ncbi:hypothetical protein RIF29_23518 [Crotalaria pallida]|uniref:Uncharacterized protein n=1 Tax=Crotalaria pallida TaxID=3830 RepID=A0AAN9F7V7_CROPI
MQSVSKEKHVQEDNLIKKQAFISKKPNKVRSPLGNKNPQIKNKQSSKGPNLPSYKENNPKPISVEVGSKSPKVVSDEEKRIMKGKEQVILHKMRTLQKQGFSGIDNIATYVVLPNEESVDFDLLQKGKNTVINPIPKPPDPVEDEGGGTEMLVDSLSLSSLQPKNQNDGFHQGNPSLIRLPSNHSQ